VSRPALATLPYMRWPPTAVSQAVKRPERKSDNSPAPSAAGTNEWSVVSAVPQVFVSSCLITVQGEVNGLCYPFQPVERKVPNLVYDRRTLEHIIDSSSGGLPCHTSTRVMLRLFPLRVVEN
jgi:hypothetical protein